MPISLRLMLWELLHCHQFSTTVSSQEKNALISSIQSHDKVLGLTTTSKYLQSLENDSPRKLC